MKVLHVMWSLEFGGIERLVLDLCCAQRKTGLDPNVLVATDVGQLAPAFQQAEIDIRCVPLKNGLDLRRTVIASAIDVMEEFDTVHFHCFTPAFALAAKRCSIPVVYTEHGNFGFGRPRTLADWCKRRLKNRFLTRHIEYQTFNSQFTRDHAERVGRICGRSRVVVNGVDLARARQWTDGRPGLLPDDLADHFVVGTTTRFAGFKRVDRLIDAFAALSETDQCYLLLVGDGPLRSEYERRVASAGIAGRTIFTGFQENVADYQHAMDVCVFPSVGEPFGLVAVEAMALGKPVLVMNDGGGIVEIVGAFSKEDVVDTISALTQRLEAYRTDKRLDGNLVSVETSASRAAHAETYSVQKMTAEFQSIYESVGEKER